MNVRRWFLVALLPSLLGLTSCATVGGMVPDQEPMPAARASLAPEYRMFYDALQDYGDWTLIEPYGYVFRPYNNVIGWRPYEQGYWAPSDVYGWVWISAEPYGWATYHYGDWIYDQYEGWVWIPGADWAPAWVSWQQTDNYVGWAPAFPNGYAPSAIPGGPYVYVPTGALATTDLSSQVQTRQQIGEERLGTPKPVVNTIEAGGVRFNGGPHLGDFERRFGPLTRMKIEDAPGVGRVAKPAHGPATAPATPAAPEARKPGQRPTPAGLAPELEAMRRAGEEAAQRARETAERKETPPATIEVVRPAVKGRLAAPEEKARAERPAKGERPAPGPGEAAPDTTGGH